MFFVHFFVKRNYIYYKNYYSTESPDINETIFETMFNMRMRHSEHVVGVGVYVARVCMMHDCVCCITVYDAWLYDARVCMLQESVWCMTVYVARVCMMHDCICCLTVYAAWLCMLHDWVYAARLCMLHDGVCCITVYVTWLCTLHDCVCMLHAAWSENKTFTLGNLYLWLTKSRYL